MRIGIPKTKIGVNIHPKLRGIIGKKEDVVFDDAQKAFRAQVAHLLATPPPPLAVPGSKEKEKLERHKRAQEIHAISVKLHPKIHERREEPAITNVLHILDADLSFHLRLYHIAEKLDKNAGEARRVKRELDQVSRGAKQRGELAKEQKRLQDAEKAIRNEFKRHLNELRRIERSEQFRDPIDRLKNAVVDMLNLAYWSEKDKKKISDILSSMNVYEAEFLYTTVQELVRDLNAREDDIVATIRVDQAVTKILTDFRALDELDKELKGIIGALDKKGGYRYYYMSGMQSLKEGEEMLSQASLNKDVLADAFGRLAYAVEFFKEAIHQDGAHADAYFYLAQSYCSLANCELEMESNTQEAFSHITTAIAATNEKNLEPVLVGIRNAQAGADEKQSMLEEYRRVVQEIKKLRSSAFCLFGRYYLRIDDADTAIKNFEEALKLNPGNNEAKEGIVNAWMEKIDQLCRKGEGYLGRGHPDLALDSYREANQLNYKAKGVISAINTPLTNHYNQRVNRNFLESLYGIGQCYISLAGGSNLGRCNAAIKAFSMARGFAEGYPNAILNIDEWIYGSYVLKGEICLKSGKIEEAISSFDTALKINGGGREAITGNFLAYTRRCMQAYDEGNLAQSSKDFDNAMTYFERLGIEPTNLPPAEKKELARTLTYGSLILGMTDLGASLKHAEVAIILDKDYALAHVAKARVLLRSKKNEEAIREFEMAEGMEPTIYEGGNFKYERGIAYMTEGLERYNGAVEIKNTGSDDSAALREFDAAIEYFRKARALGARPKKREDIDAHHRKWDIYGRRREFEKVLREMDELSKLGDVTPEDFLSDGSALYNMGINSGDVSEKIKCFRLALNYFSRMPDSLKRQHLKEIAKACLRLGDVYRRSSSRKDLEKAAGCYIAAYQYLHAIVDSQGFADDETVAELGVASIYISESYMYTNRGRGTDKGIPYLRDKLRGKIEVNYVQEAVDMFGRIENTEYYAQHKEEFKAAYADACLGKASDYSISLQEKIAWCTKALEIYPDYENAKWYLGDLTRRKAEKEKGPFSPDTKPDI